jgi:hypothetical protein
LNGLISEAPSEQLRAGIDGAIDWRLRQARQAVAAARARDQFTGLTLAGSASWSALQARRYWAKTENAIKEMERLSAEGCLADAVRLADATGGPATDAAAREALIASDAAAALQGHADSARRSVEQAEALVALAARPEWRADAEWLARTSARVTTVSGLVGRIEAGARDVAHVALEAAATSVQADVCLDVAKSNVNSAAAVRDVTAVSYDKGAFNQSASSPSALRLANDVKPMTGKDI